jgi:hypothetical protein
MQHEYDAHSTIHISWQISKAATAHILQQQSQSRTFEKCNSYTIAPELCKATIVCNRQESRQDALRLIEKSARQRALMILKNQNRRGKTETTDIR